MRHVVIAGLLLVGLAGCDSVSALFEKKPCGNSKMAATKKVGPIDNGKSASKQIDGETVVNDRPVAASFAFPRGAAIGAWARWKFILEEFDKEWTRELTVIGKRGESLWIEEVTDIQGFDEVIWRLVSPQGTVLMAYRGKPGEKGQRYTVDAELAVAADPLAGAKDTGKRETLAVQGAKLACSIRALVDGGQAWVCPAVPFSGLVKFQTDEASGQLLAHGAGRKKGKLDRQPPNSQ